MNWIYHYLCWFLLTIAFKNFLDHTHNPLWAVPALFTLGCMLHCIIQYTKEDNNQAKIMERIDNDIRK